MIAFHDATFLFLKYLKIFGWGTGGERERDRERLIVNTHPLMKAPKGKQCWNAMLLSNTDQPVGL